MRVAVTGASGFIGRHVVRELVARGVDVVAVSRHPDPVICDRVTPVALDIGAVGADAHELIGRPDLLMHLAWGGLPNYHAAAHLQAELPRHVAFLDACVEGGLRRALVAGTCLEYGMQSGCLDESLPAMPTTSYGRAKDLLRQHLEQHVAAGRLCLAWARLFYLHGPGQAPSSLYSQLLAAVEQRASEFRMSPGDQERDFLPIRTAASCLCDLALTAPDAGVVNVCGGIAKPVVSWVRQWLAEWDSNLALRTNEYPYPDYEPHSFWGSVVKLQSLVGGC